MVLRHRLVTIPVPVQRLLNIAALAEGMSLDAYITHVLTEHAELIRTSEARAEYADIRNEQLSEQTYHDRRLKAWQTMRALEHQHE